MHYGGSVWQFNVVRKLFPAYPVLIGYRWDRFMLETIDASTDIIVRVLDCSPMDSIERRMDFVLTSYRDLRDTMSSNIVSGGFYECAWVECVFNCYDTWAMFSDRDMKYETMKADKIAEITALHDLLGSAETNYTQIRDEVDALSYSGPDQWDPVTSVFKDKPIDDGAVGIYTTELTGPQIAEIETKFNDWMVAKGYL
jgi:hypothetical protein